MSDDAVALDVLPALRGDVESFDGRFLRGWASNGALQPIRLRIVANGETIGEVTADEPREDLASEALESTNCGFSVEIPRPLFVGAPCLIEIFRSDDNTEIPGSPVQIEAPSAVPAAPKETEVGASVPANREPRPEIGVAPPVAGVAKPAAIGGAPIVRGFIDGFDGTLLNGWASDGTKTPLRLRVLTNGLWHCEILADAPRDDVVDAGYAAAGCGFSIEIQRELFTGAPCLVEIHDAASGAPIPGSPFRIDPLPLEKLDFAGADLAGLSDTIVGITENISDVRQLQANVALILNWLQRNVDRAAALQQREALLVDNLNDAIGALGGLQGSIGHFFGVVGQTYPAIVAKTEEKPRVSIIIPVHNKFNLTHDCVASIVSSRTRASYEIIIVDDGSSDETLLASLIFAGGCKVVRTPKNLGFVGACNTGAASARGEFVVFLNNDTIVSDGWLDPLVDTLDRDPEIGIAGSRLLFGDGVLQESGGSSGATARAGTGAAARTRTIRPTPSCATPIMSAARR